MIYFTDLNENYIQNIDICNLLLENSNLQVQILESTNSKVDNIIKTIKNSIIKAVNYVIGKIQEIMNNIQKIVNKLRNKKNKIIRAIVKDVNFDSIFEPSILFDKINKLDPNNIEYSEDRFNTLLYDTFNISSINEINTDMFLIDKEYKFDEVLKNHNISYINNIKECINSLKNDLKKFNKESEVFLKITKYTDGDNRPGDRLYALSNYYKMYEKFYIKSVNCMLEAHNIAYKSFLSYCKKAYGDDFEKEL